MSARLVYKTPMTRAEALTKISEIEEILDAGTSTVTIGDRTITYDLPHLRPSLAVPVRYDLREHGESDR